MRDMRVMTRLQALFDFMNSSFQLLTLGADFFNGLSASNELPIKVIEIVISRRVHVGERLNRIVLFIGDGINEFSLSSSKGTNFVANRIQSLTNWAIMRAGVWNAMGVRNI